MVNPIHDRDLQEVERAYALQACDVDTILVGVRTALVMRVDSAARAKEMLRCAGVEPVTCEHILAAADVDAAKRGGYRYGAAHPAKGTVAPAYRIEPVRKKRFELNGTTMTLAAEGFF